MITQPLPPDDSTALLDIIRDPKTPAEHVKALRELSSEVKTNLEKVKEVTSRNEAALKEAQEHRNFSIQVANDAKAWIEKKVSETEQRAKDTKASLDAQASALATRETALTARELTLQSRITVFEAQVREREDALKAKEDYTEDQKKQAKDSLLKAKALQVEYETKVSKLKGILD